MPILRFSGIDSNDDLDEQFAEITKLLDYLLNGNLDFANVRVKGLTAETIDVDQLSAIAADLGHITAGLIESIQIFGSYIATSQSYPRAEMSGTSNLFGAYSTPDRYVKVDSNPNLLGAPMANFGFDGVETWLAQVGNTFFFYSPSGVVIGPGKTSFNGSVRLGGTQDLRFSSVPSASDPDEAVTSINILIAILRSMGILA